MPKQVTTTSSIYPRPPTPPMLHAPSRARRTSASAAETVAAAAPTKRARRKSVSAAGAAADGSGSSSRPPPPTPTMPQYNPETHKVSRIVERNADGSIRRDRYIVTPKKGSSQKSTEELIKQMHENNRPRGFILNAIASRYPRTPEGKAEAMQKLDAVLASLPSSATPAATNVHAHHQHPTIPSSTTSTQHHQEGSPPTTPLYF